MSMIQTNPPVKSLSRAVEPFQGAAIVPVMSELPPLLQQQNGGSAVAAMASILAYLGEPLGADDAQARIQAAVAESDLYSLNSALCQFAQALGFHAEVYNKGHAEEVAALTMRKIPVMCLIDVMPPQGMLHYVLVEGVSFASGPDGARIPKRIDYIDPALGERLEEPWGYFDKQWAKVRRQDSPTGFERFFLAVAPPSTKLPMSRPIDPEAIARYHTTPSPNALPPT